MTPPRKPPDQAEVVTLSGSVEAVIRSSGKVTLLDGRLTWAITDREMPKLVAAWLDWELRRREGTTLAPCPIPPELVERLRAAVTASTVETG